MTYPNVALLMFPLTDPPPKNWARLKAFETTFLRLTATEFQRLEARF
jgi:hypothetical protein